MPDDHEKLAASVADATQRPWRVWENAKEMLDAVKRDGVLLPIPSY
jgi:hypothetical protein